MINRQTSLRLWIAVALGTACLALLGITAAPGSPISNEVIAKDLRDEPLTAQTPVTYYGTAIDRLAILGQAEIGETGRNHVGADGIYHAPGVLVDRSAPSGTRRIYVVDTGNNRVLKYNQPFSADTTNGKGDGHLYLADEQFHTVFRYALPYETHMEGPYPCLPEADGVLFEEGICHPDLAAPSPWIADPLGALSMHRTRSSHVPLSQRAIHPMLRRDLSSRFSHTKPVDRRSTRSVVSYTVTALPTFRFPNAPLTQCSEGICHPDLAAPSPWITDPLGALSMYRTRSSHVPLSQRAIHPMLRRDLSSRLSRTKPVDRRSTRSFIYAPHPLFPRFAHPMLHSPNAPKGFVIPT